MLLFREGYQLLSISHCPHQTGLDLPKAMTTHLFFPRVLNALLARFITFPIPTIAAINGHCFAGGLTLALAHDFRIMKEAKGRDQIWCALNEVDFGANVSNFLVFVAYAGEEEFG